MRFVLAIFRLVNKVQKSRSVVLIDYQNCLDSVFFALWGAPFHGLCECHQFYPSFYVKSCLSTHRINDVLYNGRKPAPPRPIVEMTQAKVLLDDIALFGKLLVSLLLICGQLLSSCILPHDAVFDIVEAQKISIRLSIVTFMWVNLLQRLLRVETVRRAVCQRRGVMG